MNPENHALIVQIISNLIGGGLGAGLVLARFWTRLRGLEYEIVAGREQITREVRKRAAESRWEPKVSESIAELKNAFATDASNRASSPGDILRAIKARRTG